MTKSNVDTRPALHIRFEIACITGPDGEEYRLGQPLSRILSALVELHHETPEAGISLARLVEIGWPGERVSTEAGKNRAYVALTQLRRMGLREHIERCEEGYRLAPSIRVHTRSRALSSASVERGDRDNPTALAENWMR